MSGAYTASMATLNEPLDKVYRPALTAGGAVIFPHPCHFVDTPSNAAVASRRDGLLTDSGSDVHVGNAGFQTIEVRRISVVSRDACRELPMARIGAQRPEAERGPEETPDTSRDGVDVRVKAGDETGCPPNAAPST